MLRPLALAALIVLGCGDTSTTDGTSSALAADNRSAGQSQQSSSAALPTENDVEGVRAVFLAYKKAVYDKDGEGAAKAASSTTIEYFETSRRAALSMPEATLRTKPLMFKLMVLMIRARLSADRLKAMDGRGLFVYAVNDGLVGQEGRNLEPHKIDFVGNNARLGIRKGETILPPELGFKVPREQGQWKLDVMSVADNDLVKKESEKAFASVDPDLDVAIVKIVAMHEKRPIGPEIWTPLEEPPP